MDLQPPIQIHDSGFGSWHPARRPNTHELEANGEQVKEPSVPIHDVDGNGVLHGFTDYAQKELSQGPIHPHLGEYTGSSFALPPNPEYPVNNETDTSLDDNILGKSKRREHSMEDDREQGAITIEEHIRADPASLMSSQDALGKFAEEPKQEVMMSNVGGIEHASNLSPKLKSAEATLRQNEEIDRAFETEQTALGSRDLSRTNSFPVVPQIEHTLVTPPQALPHSQAEEIMEEDEDTYNSGYGHSTAPSQLKSGDGHALYENSNPNGGGEDESFSIDHNVENSVSALEVAGSSRYEEGLPLVASKTRYVLSKTPRDFTHDAGRACLDGEEGGDDFFDGLGSNGQEDTSAFRPHPLDRKSTTQVLDSMYYAPHSATQPEPASVDDRLSHANMVGGGIAISTSTVKSQVFAEQQMDLGGSETKDEDLAEMWKAVLGDDDLLEDNGTSIDPSGFFGDDDEGFLTNDDDQIDEPGQQMALSPPILEPEYGPDGSMQGFGDHSRMTAPVQNHYAPSTSFHPRNSASPSYYGAQQLRQVETGPQGPMLAPTGSQNAAGQTLYSAQISSRPQMPASTQSFANQSKGGYTSPYDLPMDVSRPKKRTINQQIRPNSDAQPSSSRPPPPRSSSMFTGASPQLDSQPPLPPVPITYAFGAAGIARPPPLKATSSTGSFFEELMPSSRPRPSSSVGQGPHPTSRSIPPPAPPMSSQLVTPKKSFTAQPASVTAMPYQLLPPERMSIYGNEHQVQASRQALPVTNARYSPAPLQSSSAMPPPNRYAASPAGATRPPFQPRTSSPLAQNHTQPQQGQQILTQNVSSRRPGSSGTQASSLHNSTFPAYPSHQGPSTMDPTITQKQSIVRTPDRSQSSGAQASMHPSQLMSLTNIPSDSSHTMNQRDADQFPSDGSTSFHQPHDDRMNIMRQVNGVPPQRSQTQSPGTGRYRPDVPASSQAPYQRPASVNQQASLQSSDPGMQAISPPRPRGRTISKNLDYIKPFDGRELDHLERWKGCPIFSFGFGGSIVTTFPKQVPRYAAGQSVPMIKCSPGEVKIQDASILPLDYDVAAFPGPLKSKSRKKDVLEWLQKRVSGFETGVSDIDSGGIPSISRKHHEEKTLLWKIVRVFVEYDGVIDGNPSAEKAVRTILSPEPLLGDSTAFDFRSFNADIVGISRRSGSHNIAQSVSLEDIEGLRKLLLQGEREQAVWHAVDNHLWAHAMLLSSTLDQRIWRQVLQEFVRQEINTFGENTESLAALYQVFAGNWEESVDELVPPSARAGLQMVSKSAHAGPTKNALAGLDRWRETLTLILSNRTPEDGKALVALGNLLAGYSRTEAAHICFLFAKFPSLFGGPDDPQVSVALLGLDHLQHSSDYGRDIDCILLTEAYEFARTVLSSSSGATVSPHLQSYKLYHAMILAEYGHKSEAQQYCEVITSALNSTTKRSSYYHNLLLAALDNLVDRLRQAPRDASGSWISKPSIDKVSGSLWAKFNHYVAGDESDAASTGSGRAHEHHVGSADAGPFALMTGDSPSLSRTPSSTDLYGSSAPGLGTSPSGLTANSTNSRYAPAGIYTPRSSLEQTARSSHDLQRPTTNDSLRPVLTQPQYQSRPTSSAGSFSESYKLTPLTSSYAPQPDSYLPTPPSQSEYMPVAPPDEVPSPVYQQQMYQSTLPLEPQSFQQKNHSQSNRRVHNIYETPLSTDMPPSSAYEPPSYDPPASVSCDTEASLASNSPVEEKRKKASFMDDNEDDFKARAAAMRKEDKARKDREAEEAFRKAAEADAHKDNAPKLNSKKSGWFGGWLGSKKEGDAAPGTPNAPIKAKLGEQSSFYYDAEKKRWVDKKNPDLTPAAAAPLPPPKGPPSRAVSAAGGPPPASTPIPPVPPLPMPTTTPPMNGNRPLPPFLPSSGPPSQHRSRSQSPTVHQNEGVSNRPVSLQMATGPASGPPSAPPSRPGTGMSGASNIDDLIGAPQARKGGTVRKAKKGRGYVDVMAK